MGVLFLLVPLAILPWSDDPYFVKNLILSLFVFGALLRKTFKKEEISFGKISTALIFFTAATLISVVGSSNTDVSFLRVAEILPVVILVFLLGKEERENSKKWLFAAVIFLSIISILQKLSFLYHPGPFGGRVYATVGNPNFLSSFLIISFPFFAESVLKKKKFFLLFLPWISIWLAGTAGTILAFVLISGAIFFKTKEKIPGIIFVLHLILVLSLSPGGLKEKKSSIEERIFKWKVGFEIFKENPLIGCGAGAVKTNFALYQSRMEKEFRLKSTSESKIHNDYIQILAETGIIGFSFFILLLAISIRLLWRKNFFVSISLVAFALDCITNFPMELPASAILLSLALSETNQKSKRTILAPVLVVFVAAVFIVANEFYAGILRKRGMELYSQGKITQACATIEKAHKLSPTNGKILHNLGMMYVNEKNYSAAIKAFEESIKIRNYGEVYNNLGNAYFLSGEKEKAIKAWQKAVELGIKENPLAQKETFELK